MNTQNNILRQCFGIDVSKDTFAVHCSNLMPDYSIKNIAHRCFKNTYSDIKVFIKWAQKFMQNDIQPLFVMEATGVYYEALAFTLIDSGL